jgi:ribosomal protein S18 acetylase RimI-like enzyme
MMSQVEIRAATVKDIGQILPLWEALAAFHGDLDPSLAVERGAVRDYAEFLGLTLGRSDTCVMVGLEGARAVSFALGRIQVLPLRFREQRRGWIQDVYTVPERRRQGIGRGVVEGLLRWFGNRRVNLVELTVAAANPDAIRFWERLGFATYMYRMKRAAGGSACST